MDAAPTTTSEDPAPWARAPRWLLVLIALLVLGGIVAVAAWQVGEAPGDIDAGLPTAPPPLALPSDVGERTPLAKAAAQLAAGQLDAARAAFIDVVAEEPDDVVGQVGLIYSRWRSTGPRSVERDLRQLSLEYPESAHAMLHLGLVQTLLEDQRSARATLRSAVELGRTAADPTSLRMARIAEDLLHPKMFRGQLPVLVTADEVDPSQRTLMRRLLTAVADDDPRRAASIAARIDAGDRRDLARVAAIAATFDKADPDVAPERLEQLADAPSVEDAVRDRARFMAALARLWGGAQREAGCRRLAASTTTRVDAATRRLARPIHAELCSTPSNA